MCIYRIIHIWYKNICWGWLGAWLWAADNICWATQPAQPTSPDRLPGAAAQPARPGRQASPPGQAGSPAH